MHKNYLFVPQVFFFAAVEPNPPTQLQLFFLFLSVAATFALFFDQQSESCVTLNQVRALLLPPPTAIRIQNSDFPPPTLPIENSRDLVCYTAEIRERL